jgi:predicted AAA+ superfamily ATPase
MIRIGDIVSQNPWWRHGEAFIRYDPNLQRTQPIFFDRRVIELKQGGIYILRGPRQVGKTTYLKETIRKLIGRAIPAKNILYLSLDSFASRREMRNGIETFLDLTRDASERFIFLDEITSIRDWNLELKRLADQGIPRGGVILATGSSALKLKEEGELLPGRGVEGNEYYLKPLPFREFVLQTMDWIAGHLTQNQEFQDSFRGLRSVLEESSVDLSWDLEEIKKEVQKILPFKRELAYLFRIYLITGGFPGVINHYLRHRFIEGKENIEPQVSEVFIRDVLGDLSRLEKQEIITRQIFRAIIERYTSRFSFTHLSREIERSHITTMDYLQCLEDSFISFILYAYDFNKKEPKWKGDKKVYFLDPMVYHSVKAYLRGEPVFGVITETMMDEELLGRIVEGVVISHLRMHREIPLLRSPETFLWNYYDRSGKELDAIVKGDGEYLGIEIKYRNIVTGERMKKISPIKKYIILSKEDVGGGEDPMVVPVDLFLSLLSPSERNL